MKTPTIVTTIVLFKCVVMASSCYVSAIKVSTCRLFASAEPCTSLLGGSGCEPFEYLFGEPPDDRISVVPGMLCRGPRHRTLGEVLQGEKSHVDGWIAQRSDEHIIRNVHAAGHARKQRTRANVRFRIRQADNDFTL